MLKLTQLRHAFNEINAQRTAAGCLLLIRSDDLYNSTTFHMPKIFHTTTVIVLFYRRESDGSVVANKWLSSGIRELPHESRCYSSVSSLCCHRDSTYYWTLNYQ